MALFLSRILSSSTKRKFFLIKSHSGKKTFKSTRTRYSMHVAKSSFKNKESLTSLLIGIDIRSNSESLKWTIKVLKKYFSISKTKMKNSGKEITLFHSKNIQKSQNRKPYLKKLNKESDSSKILILLKKCSKNKLLLKQYAICSQMPSIFRKKYLF